MLAFSLVESPCHEGKYYIAFDSEKCDKVKIGVKGGSYAVFASRLFGFGYKDYLKMCRDVYGAELFGKGTRYVIALWSKKDWNKGIELVKELNKRLNYVLKEG